MASSVKISDADGNEIEISDDSPSASAARLVRTALRALAAFAVPISGQSSGLSVHTSPGPTPRNGRRYAWLDHGEHPEVRAEVAA